MPEVAAPVRRNKFGAKCSRCTVWIPSEAGLLTKNDAGKWIVTHEGDCDAVILDRAVKAVAPALGAAPAAPVERVDPYGPGGRWYKGPALPDGCYAVAILHEPIRFYRIVTRQPGQRYAGRTFMNRYSSDDLHRVRVSLAEEREAREEIVRDPAAAQMLFAKELKRCWTCFKLLTDEESRAFGQGPDCGGRRGKKVARA